VATVVPAGSTRVADPCARHTFARRVMAVLMPAGTKRRRVFDAIVRRMTERIEIDPSAT